MKKARFIFTVAAGLVLSSSAMAQDVKQSKKAELKPTQTVQPVREQKAQVAQPAAQPATQPVQQPVQQSTAAKPMKKIPVKKIALKRALVNENPELQKN
jgi:hemolysin activation/secretion protein